MMEKSFRPSVSCSRQGTQGGSVVCQKTPDLESRDVDSIPNVAIDKLQDLDASPEPCLAHNRHLMKFVDGISMREFNESVLSEGVLKDLLGGGGGRETSRL